MFLESLSAKTKVWTIEDDDLPNEIVCKTDHDTVPIATVPVVKEGLDNGESIRNVKVVGHGIRVEVSR